MVPVFHMLMMPIPGNDCSSSVVVVVSARRPDLSVSALSVNGTTMLPAGEDLASFSYCHQWGNRQRSQQHG